MDDISTSSIWLLQSHLWFWHMEKMADWNLVATFHLLLGCTKMVRRMHGISIFEFVNCWWQIMYNFLLYVWRSKVPFPFGVLKIGHHSSRKWQIMIKCSLPRCMFTFSWKPLPVEQHWWLDKELRNMQMNLGKGLPCQPCPLSFFSPPHTRFYHHIQHPTSHTPKTHIAHTILSSYQTLSQTRLMHTPNTHHTQANKHTHTQPHTYTLILNRKKKKAIYEHRLGWLVGPPGSQARPYIRQSTNGQAGWRGGWGV